MISLKKFLQKLCFVTKYFCVKSIIIILLDDQNLWRGQIPSSEQNTVEM